MSTFLNRFNRPPASVSLASASQHVEDYSPWVTPPRTRGGPASTSDATTHDEGVAALVALLRSTPSLINTVRSIVHAPADTLTRSNSSDLWSDEGGEEVSACASHSDQVILLTPSKLVGAFDSTEVLREVGNGPTDSLGTVVLIKKHERLLLKGTNRDDQKILALIGKGLETKFGVETVWFREEIVKRGILLLKISTTEQLGDLCTKGLSKAVFQYLRKKLMGW